MTTTLPRITDRIMETLQKKNGHITAIVMLALELDALEARLRRVI